MDAASLSDRRFFTTMACAALAIMFLGFATTYYLWPITRATYTLGGQPISPEFPLVLHLHAAGFTVWILLLVAQVRLIAIGRTALHRRVGLVAAWLVPLLIVAGFMTSMQGARDGLRPVGFPGDALGFMIVPVGDIVVFTALLIPGLAFRRRPGVHKRLMLLATLGGLMPPAITRMPVTAGHPVPGLALFSALVLAPAVWDFWRGSPHRWLSLSVGIGILASVVFRVPIGMTDAWRAFAAWLVR